MLPQKGKELGRVAAGGTETRRPELETDPQRPGARELASHALEHFELPALHIDLDEVERPPL